MATSLDELSNLPPSYQKVIDEVVQALIGIKRTGWGTISVEIKDHKRWRVRGSTSSASSAYNN